MEDYTSMTNDQAKMLIRAIRIINELLKDPEELDRRLKEIEEVEKGDTAADQDKR